MSVRHFGWDADERERLAQECGARVSVSPEDGYLTVEEGRLRGFQLAMTRALGHRLLSGYGVSAEPSGAVGFPLWWGMGVGRSWHGVGWLQCRAAEMGPVSLWVAALGG